MNEQEIKQKLNNTVGKSFIYDKKKIFINKIESSDLYYKIHIDGDLLIFKKENIETEFLDLIQTKIKFETIVPVKPIPSVFKNQTIETNTPATTIEFNTPATTMESNTPATTIETNTPATTMESNTPATTIETNTPATTMESNTPATTIETNTPATTMESNTPATTIETNTPATTMESNTPATTIETNTPATTMESNTPATTIETNTPATTMESNTPATTIETNTPATTMESNTPATTIETNTPATTMESNTPATTIETNTLTTQNNLPSTESQIVEFSFKSQADLYNSALDGSNELKDALKDTLTRLKAATTTEQLEMEMTRSKGVAMISKEMNSLMNSKIKAIQVISNS